MLLNRKSYPFAVFLHLSVFTLGAILLPHSALSQSQPAQLQKAQWTVDRICQEIEASAKNYGVPKDFFARLIWTESRFDINALSPVGAQGIAQFMPATTQARGLTNAYDPGLALPASAELLRDHKEELGNWVLAAAAYNAGVKRVSRWIAGTSSMPFETQNYIVSIFNVRIDRFKNRDAIVRIPALNAQQAFDKACRSLPIMNTRAKPNIAGFGGGPVQPWGVQVSGSFSQNKAINVWLRVRAKLGLVVEGSPPNIHRLRTPRGMRSRWAVRLGASNRNQANTLCARIRRAKGSCIVLKNKRD